MGCAQSKGTSEAVCTATNVKASPVAPKVVVSPPASNVQSPQVETTPRQGRPSTQQSAGETRSRSTTPTPSLDGSTHSSGSSTSRKRQAKLGIKGSASALGLDKMIDEKRDAKRMSERIVHIEVPFGKPIEEVYNGVHDGPVLGSGISGLVRLATHKTTGLKYAVKCLDLDLVDTEEGLQQLREEIYIMCQLDHPNIVRLEEVYESHSEIYLVQELCIGGELFDRLDEQPDYHYTEAQCARLVKQMLCSVRYIHSKGIIHRDLKLENFLFSDSSAESELKMIDFGLSKHFTFGEVQHEAVGTPYTVAPEVIRGSYDERCDVWAIGVITYLLLSGESPFGGCGGPEPLMLVRDNILKGDYEFEPAEVWAEVSELATTFIKRLLVTDPTLRPTAREVQKDPWLTEMANRSKTNDDSVLNPNVVKALVNFKEYSDMRKLLCEVLSFTLIPDQIQGLRKEFEKMDTDGSGEISMSALKSVLLGNAAQGSLGALTEEEVEDIFNAMRVSKTETTIHWHEFIAAGLSNCKVDERNLRLAFDRLDADHTGYITFENFMDLIGNGAVHSEQALREMWGEASMNSDQERITYEDFLLLMKGQTKPAQKISQVLNTTTPALINTLSLHSVMEVHVEETSPTAAGTVQKPGTPVRGLSEGADFQGGFMSPTFEEDSDDLSEGPVCIDDEEGALNDGFAEAMQHQSSGVAIKGSIVRISKANSSPDDRGRSKSFDGNDKSPPAPPPKPSMFIKNALRAVNLPEHDHTNSKMDNLIKDKTKTPLVVNRELYRAHRQMRLAVHEASKRLEEEQQRRAREEMRKEQLMSNRLGAGLIMRHGGELSADAIKQLVQKRQQEEQKKVQEAVSRSGRRHNRNKTASDIRGMFGTGGSDINNLTLPKTCEMSPHGAIPNFGKPFSANSPAPPSQKVIAPDLPELPKLNATKPGQFRKTKYDPFSYGVSHSSKDLEREDSSMHHHLDHTLKPIISSENLGLKPSGSDTNLMRGTD